MKMTLHQTKLNQTYQIKPTKPNLPNQTFQTKPTKPNLQNSLVLRENINSRESENIQPCKSWNWQNSSQSWLNGNF